MIVDLLMEDRPISGQKFMCVSFVSSETICKNKQLFLFNEFIKNWDLCKPMEKYQKFTNFLAFKYELNPTLIQQDLQDFIKEEQLNLLPTTIEDEFKTFMDQHEEQLDDEFNKRNKFNKGEK